MIFYFYKEIESGTKNLSTKVQTEPDDFTVNSTHFERKIDTNLLQILPENKEKGIIPNSLCDVSITLLPKPDKTVTRKLQTNILYEWRYKNPQQKTSKWSPE